MKFKKLAKIHYDRQDGAIFGGYLFSFDHLGNCIVYKTDELLNSGCEKAEPFAEFVIDKVDQLKPHCNAVMFGTEYYSEEDEFPLLYANIYNNYAKAEDKMKGVCVVYRIQRTDDKFTAAPVQVIKIGFTENEELWCSAKGDVRPYGNFTIDREKNVFYAFTMRDGHNSARYFSFDLPKVMDGEICQKCGARKVVLEEADIKEYFDCDYHHFIQGACCNDGKIYSLEGFDRDEVNPAALRVIDTHTKKECMYIKFEDFELLTEPELIDFDNGRCIYADNPGNCYEIEF